jgi:hypothetical protein
MHSTLFSDQSWAIYTIRAYPSAYLLLGRLGTDDRVAHHAEVAVLIISESRRTTILELAAKCLFKGLVHERQLGIVGNSASIVIARAERSNANDKELSDSTRREGFIVVRTEFSNWWILGNTMNLHLSDRLQ